MIIDSHTHFGKILDFDMPCEMLIRSMDTHGIDCAVVSNIEGVEFDHEHKPIPTESLHDQIEINMAAIEFSWKFPGRIFPLLWVMPNTGGASDEFQKLIVEYRQSIYGIKVHPCLNNIDFDSILIEPYIEIAAKYKLPVVTHTASTSESSPGRVARMAWKYPQVKFLMVHMGLYTDNEEAIELILKYPNLYGDTTWVKPENALKLINRGGIDKIMFGTDAPIEGLNGYSNPLYRQYLENLENILGSVDYKKLICENAKKFFGIY